MNSSRDLDMSLYNSDYENALFAETNAYYAKESQVLVNSLPVEDFLQRVNDRLEAEGQRVTRFFHPSSHEKIIYECTTQYVTKNSTWLLAEFPRMLINGQHNVAALAYRLLLHTPDGAQSLSVLYGKYVLDNGRKLDVQDPKAFVEMVGAFISRHTQQMVSLFKEDPYFAAAMNEAARKIVNEYCTLAPEFLGKYIDILLQRSNKMSDSEVQEKLNTVFLLFNYIDEKDVFQRVYSRYLAKRLVQKLSTSDELEHSVVARLKDACGFEFINKLQRMFTDVALSSEVSLDFSEYIRKCKPFRGLETHVLVLTACSWPISTSSYTPITFPPRILTATELFAEFYNTKHSGRKLSWIWSLCRVDVCLHGFDKPYEISMPLAQSIVLNMLNDHESVSYDQVAKATGSNKADAARALSSLEDAGLLVSREAGTYSINHDFTNKKCRFRLLSSRSPANLKPSQQPESDADAKAIDRERLMLLEAAIVRLMKARKDLDQSEIIEAIVRLTSPRFKPSIVMIKTVLAQLVEKQYLKLSDDSRYQYVA